MDVGLVESLRRQKIKFFWFLYGCWPRRKPPAAKIHVFLIFRLLLNAFWHAETIDLVEGFRNHRSDLNNLHSASSYCQNIAKIETWSQCCIWNFANYGSLSWIYQTLIYGLAVDASYLQNKLLTLHVHGCVHDYQQHKSYSRIIRADRVYECTVGPDKEVRPGPTVRPPIKKPPR